MPDFFEEVFSYCQEDLRNHLDLKALDPSYKIFYPDGDVITVHKDSEKTKEELEKIEKGSSKGFDGFIEEATRIYNKVKPLLYGCFTAKAMFNPAYWGLIGEIRAFESYWQLAKKFFKSKKLCYAFTFEAMFMGVSPFDVPAFYSVISYTDHVQKIFYPMGSMYQIPRALEKLAQKFGAKFNYNAEVKKIYSDNGRIKLILDKGEAVFDKVVANTDYAYTKTDLLARRIPEYNYSCSAYLLYLGLKQKVKGLAHHNLFFSQDLNKNLNQIFRDQALPEDPSFYINVPTVTDESLAPKGKDLFYILVPVPNLKRLKQDFLKEEEKLRGIIFNRINQTMGIRLQDLIEIEHKFYPDDFTKRYNIKYGATFGLAHNLMQSAFFRPPNFDSKIQGLYYVGASTQPGGGLPVVLASSRIVADLITGNS